MKKIALGIIALALALPALHAQEKTSRDSGKEKGAYGYHSGKHGKHAQNRYEKLNLSKEQQDEMAKINQEYRAALSDLKKKETTITAKEYRTQAQALNQKRRKDADKILTKEQQEQLQQSKNSRRGRGVNAARNPQHMKTELGLTDAQSDKMNSLKTDTQNKVKQIRANTALTDQQKKEQITEVYKQQHEGMKQILSPEQMKKMEELRGGRNHRAVK